MCLDIYKINKDAHVAEEDITVYKYIRVNDDKTLETPYQNAEVVIGETYNSELNVRFVSGVDENYEKLPDDYVVKIVTNGLHSFGRFKDAYKHKSYSSDRIVVECVIPKGSTYYIGEFDDKLSYASTELRYVKKFGAIAAKIKNFLN